MAQLSFPKVFFQSNPDKGVFLFALGMTGANRLLTLCIFAESTGVFGSISHEPCARTPALVTPCVQEPVSSVTPCTLRLDQALNLSHCNQYGERPNGSAETGRLPTRIWIMDLCWKIANSSLIIQSTKKRETEKEQAALLWGGKRVFLKIYCRVSSGPPAPCGSRQLPLTGSQVINEENLLNFNLLWISVSVNELSCCYKTHMFA